MFNLKNQGISAKVNYVVCLIILVGFLILSVVLLSNIYAKSMFNAERMAKDDTLIGAASIEAGFSKTEAELFRIKDTLVYGKESRSISREDAVRLLKKYLSNNSDVLAFSSLWEHNQYDGLDSRYVNKIGHDHTGMFIPYLSKTSKGISYDPLVDYDKEGAGDYYLVPKRTGLVTLTNPYIYPVDGKDVLMASLIVPVFGSSHNVIGMVGADFKLDYLQKLIEKINPMGGYSALVSADGKFVANGADPKAIMQDASKFGLNMEKIQKGEEFKEYVYMPSLKKLVLRVYTPIHLKDTNSYWSFISIIPKNIILADFYFYLRLMVLILIVLLGVTIFVNAKYINALLEPVNNIVYKLSDYANQLSLGADKYLSLSQKLAQGSIEQAASVQETSATLDESASITNQNNENTKYAVVLSNSTRDAAGNGNKEMTEMVDSMQELQESNKEIEKIIEVISKIASQTNILAINAAVEAARAGEAGQGFSVVAEEVRSLAESCAEAATSISEIIEKNLLISEKGVNISQKVYSSLDEINKQAQKVNQLLNEIATSSNEQLIGITQITTAMNQIGQVAQVNSLQAEETTQVSKELAKYAENIQNLVVSIENIVNGNQLEQ